MGKCHSEEKKSPIIPEETIEDILEETPLQVKKFNLNTITWVELYSVTPDMIGKKICKSICEDRDINGSFKTWEDMIRVPGVGIQKMKAIRDCEKLEIVFEIPIEENPRKKKNENTLSISKKFLKRNI